MRERERRGRNVPSTTVIALILLEKVADLKFSLKLKASDKVYFLHDPFKNGNIHNSTFYCRLFWNSLLSRNFGFLLILCQIPKAQKGLRTFKLPTSNQTLQLSSGFFLLTLCLMNATCDYCKNKLLLK